MYVCTERVVKGQLETTVSLCVLPPGAETPLLSQTLYAIPTVPRNVLLGMVGPSIPKQQQPQGFAQQQRTLAARAAARDAFVPVGAPPLPLRSPYIMFAKERRGPLMATLDAPAGSARFGAASTLLGQEWAVAPSPAKRRASAALGA